jgi:hypothetical protein
VQQPDPGMLFQDIAERSATARRIEIDDAQVEKNDGVGGTIDRVDLGSECLRRNIDVIRITENNKRITQE